MRVLVIEDHADIVENLYGFLEPLGYKLDCVRNGHAGLTLASERHYDAIILDIMLPGLDGLEVCRKIRNELRRDTPILMLTARDSVQDKLIAFENGADDYVVKPFALAELDARLKALLRRTREVHAADPVLQYAELRYDTKTLLVTRAGQKIELTPTGYKLLARLLRSAPGVVTRDVLEYAVWADDPPESDALRTHIHSLRQALDKPFAGAMLETLPGLGYRLIDPDEQ